MDVWTFLHMAIWVFFPTPHMCPMILPMQGAWHAWRNWWSHTHVSMTMMCTKVLCSNWFSKRFVSLAQGDTELWVWEHCCSDDTPFVLDQRNENMFFPLSHIHWKAFLLAHCKTRKWLLVNPNRAHLAVEGPLHFSVVAGLLIWSFHFENSQTVQWHTQAMWFFRFIDLSVMMSHSTWWLLCFPLWHKTLTFEASQWLLSPQKLECFLSHFRAWFRDMSFFFERQSWLPMILFVAVVSQPELKLSWFVMFCAPSKKLQLLVQLHCFTQLSEQNTWSKKIFACGSNEWIVNHPVETLMIAVWKAKWSWFSWHFSCVCLPLLAHLLTMWWLTLCHILALFATCTLHDHCWDWCLSRVEQSQTWVSHFAIRMSCLQLLFERKHGFMSVIHSMAQVATILSTMSLFADMKLKLMWLCSFCMSTGHETAQIHPRGMPHDHDKTNPIVLAHGCQTVSVIDH